MVGPLDVLVSSVEAVPCCLVLEPGVVQGTGNVGSVSECLIKGMFGV